MTAAPPAPVSVHGARGAVIAGRSTGAVVARLAPVDGRTVAWFELAGGRHAGAIGPAEGQTLVRLVEQAVAAGVPIVGVISSSGADIEAGVASLHAWGRLARALAHASGVVPIVLAVTGPCLSGPALLLGLADHVVMTPGAFAYVSGPAAVRAMTGVEIDHEGLGGAAMHAARSGVASLVVAGDDVQLAIGDLLSFLPSNHLDDPPLAPTLDPVDRGCDLAAAAVPADAKAGYDVRSVISDVLDAASFLEVRAAFAPNMVTGYGRVNGCAVGVVASQPAVRAGTIDIAAASKAARFVQGCDSFNVPIVTFVDTPGFEPGRDLEWRGMIRHGAELVYAYAAASVPRVCVIVRKSYGGAYIVMDSRTLGNDACFAWAGSEIAVMGASGAVAVLHGKRLAAIRDSEERADEQAALEADYVARFCTPEVAAARGLVDDVIDPADTRRVVADALAALRTKREHPVARKHGNSPL